MGIATLVSRPKEATACLRIIITAPSLLSYKLFNRFPRLNVPLQASNMKKCRSKHTKCTREITWINHLFLLSVLVTANFEFSVRKTSLTIETFHFTCLSLGHSWSLTWHILSTAHVHSRRVKNSISNNMRHTVRWMRTNLSNIFIKVSAYTLKPKWQKHDSSIMSNEF